LAYRVPNFNLTCDIWTGVVALPGSTPPVGPPRLSAVDCALVYGQRVNVASTGGTSFAGVPLLSMCLLLPKGTDIRGPQDVSLFPDLVECPSASGRYYWVVFVDDIGKGWPNEHRTASVFALVGTWTPPYP
jgi:hypothetical protein